LNAIRKIPINRGPASIPNVTELNKNATNVPTDITAQFSLYTCQPPDSQSPSEM
jgi:hypothetical protein